ncbi:MAG: ABC transporter permease [bacterium]|nr:ABC transporter permease [bacterium]
MIQDLRYALRTLLKSPGPSTVAVLVLALGIGANTVVFSLVHGLMLEPLGFERPDRLVRFFGTEAVRGSDRQRVSEATVAAALEPGRGFEQIAGAMNTGLSVTDSERPLNPLMRRVTSGWFEMLGVNPLFGRTFSAEEHRQGARVVILNHGFWLSHFGGDPNILGRTIELAEETYEVIGVMSPSFQNAAFPRLPVLWMPVPEITEPSPGRANWVLIGRLADGTGLAQAQQEADRLAADLAKLYPDAHRVRGLRVMTLHHSMVELYKPALMVLFGAVGLVLLIACSNVANLLLTRALGRRQEIAVRQALGAGRRHLARQLLTESLLISLLGAGLGVLAAYWSIGPLTRLAPSNISVPLLDQVGVEPRVILFSLFLACLTTLFFGLLPLRQLFRDSADILSAGASRAIGGRARRRLRSLLVVVELAVSMMLLIAAGLTVRSLQNLRGLDLGFEPEGLLYGRTGARGPGFETPDRYEPFHREVLERLGALPGVESVGGIEFLPTFAGTFGGSAPVAPQGTVLPPESRPQASLLSTLPGYFDVARQPILAGRDFTDHDSADGEPVAVISHALSRRLFGDEDPVGRTLVVGEGESVINVRLVGLAGDLRGVADNPLPPPILYRPLAQRPTMAVTFYVRRPEADETRLLAMIPAVEDAVWSISRDVPVFALSTMEQLVRDVEWQPRFVVQLLTGFALLALILAATGIYAVLAYAVRERTREIGIRVAVGAGRGNILRMVGRDALRLAVIGVGLGVLLALGASRVLESQLLNVSTRDPWIYALLAASLVAVALLASFLPALRATRVDPVVALRTD